ncbi:hypothetical protein [Methylobacterium sp. SI9]|uniref:hypothetical protein n=1 Tax=Methylobacterium guangdongense TaxID=3138811 RepID=UPI00313C2533
MIVKRLRIEGNFVEAFLYFDYLWLVHASGEVAAFDIEAYLCAVTGDEFQAARTVFARNDLLDQPNFGNASVGQQNQSIQRFVQSDTLDVMARDVERYSILFDTRIQSKSILDMRCYYGRTYISTEKQILQFSAFGRSDLAHLKPGYKGNGRLGGATVHDSRCLQFRAQHGVVSAACGRDGGFYAAGANSADAAWKATFRRFASQSRATEFLSDTVANVKTGTDLELYSTRKTESSSNDDSSSVDEERADYIISELEEVIESSSLTGGIDLIADLKKTSFKRLFLTRRGGFAQDDNLRIHSIRLVENNRLSSPKAGAIFPATSSDVLSLTTCPMGIIAELDDAVVVLSGGRWSALYDQAIFSVRGYPTAKWYKNLITLVGEDRAEILFVCRP